MDREQTQFLIQDAMEKAGLNAEEAAHVAIRSQENSDAIERFEQVEGDLADLIKAFKQVKKWAMWAGGLIATNFAVDIMEGLGLMI